MGVYALVSVIKKVCRKRFGFVKKRMAAGAEKFPEAVLFFVGLTVIGTALSGKDSPVEESRNPDYVVIRESMAGNERIFLEEYLPELIWAVHEDYISRKEDGIELGEEEYKELAIRLRTIAVREAERNQSRELLAEKIGFAIINPETAHEQWNEAQKAEYEKIKKAVSETKGEIIKN